MTRRRWSAWAPDGRTEDRVILTIVALGALLLVLWAAFELWHGGGL